MLVALHMVLTAQGISISPVPEGTAVSVRADCASFCFNNRSCSSIFYDTSTSMCHLVDTVYLDEDLQSVSSNMQYMAWTTSSCGAGYTWNRALNLCFKLYSSQKTWQEAENQCVQDGGHLIKVETAAENDFTHHVVVSKGNRFWMGASDEVKEGTWVWADGSTMKIYFWARYQPNNLRGVQDCLTMRAYETDPTSSWSDEECDDKNPFICQLAISKQPDNCSV